MDQHCNLVGAWRHTYNCKVDFIFGCSFIAQFPNDMAIMMGCSAPLQLFIVLHSVSVATVSCHLELEGLRTPVPLIGSSTVFFQSRFLFSLSTLPLFIHSDILLFLILSPVFSI